MLDGRAELEVKGVWVLILGTIYENAPTKTADAVRKFMFSYRITF